jgi:hypothetical protein
MLLIDRKWFLALACLGLMSCGDAEDKKGLGQECASTEECAGELRCIDFSCTDLNADAGPTDTADAAVPEKSYYKIKINTQLGEEFEFERDITEKPNAYSFGSTHIAPAVSLAVSEDFTFPATMTVTINFGIVIGSEKYPVQSDEAGEYPFSLEPPEIDVIIGLRYRSTIAGSTGSVTITEYSNQTDGIMSGTFKGRLLQQTTKEDKKWADVEGEFRFVLPVPESGQPG